MSKSDQDLEGADQLLVCPYDSTHRITISKMGHHLNECRENVSIDEKAICPFNDKHAIFAPEMDYHKLICPEKPGGNEIRHQNGTELGIKDETPTDQLLESFSSGSTTFSFSTATGCESGLRLGGGIRNCDSFIGGTDENGVDVIHNYPDLVSNEEKQPAKNGLKNGCYGTGENDPVQAIEGLMSPSHNTVIEKQLEQSESDSSSGTKSSMGTLERLSEEERFDYTKFIPSEDLKEDFLKLIGQPRNGQVHARYHILNQPYTIQQWPPNGYSFHPALYHTHNGFQSPGVQPAFISYSNTYNIIPTVSAQGPYSGSYGFQNQSASPGSFLQAPGHVYDYNLYPAARPSYHRPYYKRRNHYNSFSPRYHNHENYSSNQHENHSQTLLNGLNQPESSGAENGCYPNKLNGTADHNHDTSKSNSSWMQIGCNNPKQGVISPKLSLGSSKVDVAHSQHQFVDISDVTDKVQFEDTESNGQNYQCASVQDDDIKKTETDKQIRKIKKKLAEISGLEEKLRQGANLDCDQLKKLSRKNEFENQLQSLYLS